jgi:hypothetical protein
VSISVIGAASAYLGNVARGVIVATVLGVIGASNASAQELCEEPVVFRDDTVRLVGTLVLPRTTGPHPAVVLVHGSGPDDGASYLHYARVRRSRHRRAGLREARVR